MFSTGSGIGDIFRFRGGIGRPEPRLDLRENPGGPKSHTVRVGGVRCGEELHPEPPPPNCHTLIVSPIAAIPRYPPNPRFVCRREERLDAPVEPSEVELAAPERCVPGVRGDVTVERVVDRAGEHLEDT